MEQMGRDPEEKTLWAVNLFSKLVIEQQNRSLIDSSNGLDDVLTVPLLASDVKNSTNQTEMIETTTVVSRWRTFFSDNKRFEPDSESHLQWNQDYRYSPKSEADSDDLCVSWNPSSNSLFSMPCGRNDTKNEKTDETGFICYRELRPDLLTEESEEKDEPSKLLNQNRITWHRTSSGVNHLHLFNINQHFQFQKDLISEKNFIFDYENVEDKSDVLTELKAEMNQFCANKYSNKTKASGSFRDARSLMQLAKYSKSLFPDYSTIYLWVNVNVWLDPKSIFTFFDISGLAYPWDEEGYNMKIREEVEVYKKDPPNPIWASYYPSSNNDTEFFKRLFSFGDSDDFENKTETKDDDDEIRTPLLLFSCLEPHDPAEIKITAEASMKFDLTYSAELNNQTSLEYLNLSKEIEDSIAGSFNGDDTFQSVSVVNFSPGSVVCDFEMTFQVPQRNIASDVNNSTSAADFVLQNSLASFFASPNLANSNLTLLESPSLSNNLTEQLVCDENNYFLCHVSHRDRGDPKRQKSRTYRMEKES